MTLNYFTSQCQKGVSGGWSGLSYSLYQYLKLGGCFEVNYVGPIYPPVRPSAKLASKVRRILGGQGRFYAFSSERLERVHQQALTARPQSDYDFFLGATPWIQCRFDRPYGAYLDACFRTYFDNNLKTDEFLAADIRRIEDAEKSWLERARDIFWASEWSRDEAIRHYQLSEDNHHVVGIGGNLEIPSADTYSGEMAFLFIAQNFALKGGPVACAAFQGVRRKRPDAKLIVLGEKPPAEFLRKPGVEYAGYLRKNRPEELAEFRSILASAFCLVHPTNSDTLCQVIIECGYFGCPAIAPRRFAIPELVLHRQTGVLIDTPFTAADFEREMLWMIEDKVRYRELRRGARIHFTLHFTFEAVTRKIVRHVREACPC